MLCLPLASGQCSLCSSINIRYTEIVLTRSKIFKKHTKPYNRITKLRTIFISWGDRLHPQGGRGEGGAGSGRGEGDPSHFERENKAKQTKISKFHLHPGGGGGEAHDRLLIKKVS